KAHGTARGEAEIFPSLETCPASALHPPYGCQIILASIIVIVIDAEAGAAGLAGLAADRQMRPHLDFDRHLAGWRRDALADADRNAGCDVFAGAQRGAAGGAARGGPRVQRAARRAGRAGAEIEPVEAEAAAQLVEHPQAAAGKRAGSRGKLEPLRRGELAH